MRWNDVYNGELMLRETIFVYIRTIKDLDKGVSRFICKNLGRYCYTQKLIHEGCIANKCDLCRTYHMAC